MSLIGETSAGKELRLEERTRNTSFFTWCTIATKVFSTVKDSGQSKPIKSDEEQKV
jgi:hypothetical protein